MAATAKPITLKGSTAIITEFFGYAVRSILYQRGIWPAEQFARTTKYGLSLLTCSDTRVCDYLKQIMKHIADWLLQDSLERLVMVVSTKSTNQVMERWVFHVEHTKPAAAAAAGGAAAQPPAAASDAGGGDKSGTSSSGCSVVGAVKSEKEIVGEIQAIIRQITASVTFLPLLEDGCTFELLAYTDKQLEVPLTWEESDARLIDKAQQVQLRTMCTSVHRIEPSVSYRVPDD